MRLVCLVFASLLITAECEPMAVGSEWALGQREAQSHGRHLDSGSGSGEGIIEPSSGSGESGSGSGESGSGSGEAGSSAPSLPPPQPPLAPSPIAPSPSAPLPPAVVELSVTFQAQGAISDFADRVTQDAILKVMADAAGLPTTGATIEITAASVNIRAVFPVASAAAASSASNLLSTAMSSPTVASALFTSAGVAVVVETTPSIAEVVIMSPSPPGLLSPSPSPPEESAGLPIGIIAGAAGGGGALLIGGALLAAWWYSRRKRQRAREAEAARKKAEAEKAAAEAEAMEAAEAAKADAEKEGPSADVPGISKEEAAERIEKMARGKSGRNLVAERKTANPPNVNTNAILSSLEAADLISLSARQRKAEELAAERERKREEKRKREERERRRKAEEAERLRLKLEEQARIRFKEEGRLKKEATVASERRVLLRMKAIVIQKDVRRFLARRRVMRAKKYRVLKRVDHIDRAILAGRGRAKLKEMREARERMEVFILQTRAKSPPKSQKGGMPMLQQV